MLENIVYDVTREPVYRGVWLLVFLGLSGALMGCGAMLAIRANVIPKGRGYAGACFGAFYFAFLAVVIANGLVVRQRCAEQARAGDFRTTVGILGSLKRSGKNEPYQYSFSLGGREFVSGGAISGACGLAPPPSSRFKFQEGQHLRIEHQDGRIYKVVLLTVPDPAVQELDASHN